ncbi:MAG: DinB family protein, partial [Vicingaceae bacterium]|nr:DinB family protein [Vicingaceae bacterium]
MQKQFDILNATRNNVLNSVKDLSIEQLNVVPTGFKNSIAWNFAHIAVTQQLLCYKLSGLEMNLPADCIDRFKKGSVASEVSEKEMNNLKAQLMDFPVKLEEDYN